MQLTDVEIRVLGCLLEKQRTTPDAYPLSLNALRLACNQATNRDPVVDYDEGEIREALTRLGRMRYTRLTSTQGSRAAKFRHLLDETMGLTADQQAVMAVLMLRGPQTAGELRQRSERLHRFADFDALNGALETLIGAGRVQRLPRRPGQKEERYRHTLGAGHSGDRGDDPTGQPAATSAPTAATAPSDEATPAPAAVDSPAGGSHGGRPVEEGNWNRRDSGSPAELDRLERLEQRVAELAAELSELRGELGMEPR